MTDPAGRRPLSGPARKYGYHDVDATQLEVPVITTPEQERLAVRAVAGSPAVADAAELSDLLAMLNLEAEKGKHE